MEMLELSNNKRLFYLLLAQLMLFSVTRSGYAQITAPDSSVLYEQFKLFDPADTLCISIDPQWKEFSQTIPVAIFTAAVDTTLIEKMHYEPDSYDLEVQTAWKFSLDDDHEACLVAMKQGWFRFKYLLIYSKSSESFVDLLPVAYLFGGDGGQIIGESWLINLSTKPTLILPQLERSIGWSVGNADEPKITNTRTVSILQWREGAFLSAPVRDPMKWIRMFPVDWE